MLRHILYSLLLCIAAAQVNGRESVDTAQFDGSGRLNQSKQDTARVAELILLSDLYYSKYPATPAILDTALDYAYAAEKLSTALNASKGLGNSYEQISKVLHKKQDITKAKQFANKAIDLFRLNGCWLELGYAYYDLSGYYSIDDTKELTERIRIVKELSLPAFQRSGIKLKEADIQKELGDLLQLKGDYVQALKMLNTALQIYKMVKYPHLQGIYNLMGAIYSVTGNNEQALRYGLLSLAVSKQVGDSTLGLATVYSRIGGTYGRMKRPDLAMEYLEKALSVATDFNDTGTIILENSNISRIEVLLNKPQSALHRLRNVSKKYPMDDPYLHLYVLTSYLIAYHHLHRYDEAQKYCDTVLSIDAKLDSNEPDRSEAQDPVTEFYLASNQNTLARRRLEMTEAFNNLNHNITKDLSNEFLFFRLDSSEGRFASAISHYQKYKSLEDSIFSSVTRSHIEQLQIEYETENKNKNIELLENKSRLQTIKLAESYTTRNWMAGIATLLIIICVLMLSYSILKRKTTRKLEKQQKEIEIKNKRLEHLITEKDWLVKEIHHRVKNNFHMVMGLLGTQAAYLTTDEAINAMRESQNRIYAMSLIHQKLYQSENLTEIDLPEFFYDLVEHLRDSLNIRQSVRFSLSIPKVQLGLSYCIPIGLILNEAITNSIKHGLSEGTKGKIEIVFSRSIQCDCVLTINDNGSGIPAGFNAMVAESMGMRLMRGLTDDLDGEFQIENRNGTRVKISFRCDSTPEIETQIKNQT